MPEQLQDDPHEEIREWARRDYGLIVLDAHQFIVECNKCSHVYEPMLPMPEPDEWECPFCEGTAW